MIGYLEGKVQGIYESSVCILTTGGVGYEVSLTTTALLTFSVGESTTLFIATIVREDAITLYGFTSKQEKDLFLLLLSINKVGAKTALAILSCFTVEQLSFAVQQEDFLALARVPGIGKKTAQHICFELQYKLKGILAAPPQFTPHTNEHPTLFQDACLALCNLGYEEKDIYALLPTLIEQMPSPTLPTLIKEALKALS